jgi:hypothetical protein
LFGEEHIPVLVFVPKEGKVVLRFSLALYFSGILEVVPDLPEKIQRNVGQGNVGFQTRTMTAKFRKPVAKDQWVVCQKQDIVVQFGIHFRSGLIGSIFWFGSSGLEILE